MLRYWPNPSHKTETTEAGPPRWNPDKDKCPSDMTVAERNELLKASIAVDPSDQESRRFVARRVDGRLELFDIKFTQVIDGEPEFHGHPAQRVPRPVLKAMRDQGVITDAEYRRLTKDLPGC